MTNHEWFTPPESIAHVTGECCRICGTVRRTDGKNGPCKGPVNVGPRGDDFIRSMVDRFLSWRLPKTFNPDGGISFKRTYNENTPWPREHEPTGTNLFSAEEARQMVIHMLATPNQKEPA